MSDTFQTLSGYPAESFIGNADRSYSSLIHPEDLGAVRHTILGSLTTQLLIKLSTDFFMRTAESAG